MIGRKSFLAHVAIVLCGVGGLFAWGGVLTTWRHSELLAQDWIVYYAAISAALAGKVSLIFDAASFTRYQYETLTPWFSAAPVLHPWLYPPHYLLLLVPFGLLPFAPAYAAFVLITAVAALAALARWPRGLMLFFFPASCVTALTGQNAFLSTALLIGGFRLLDKQPVLGAIALGALSYKPQLWLMVPVALAARRAWRPLFLACVTASVLVLASVTFFGLDAWRLWLDETVRAQDPAYNAWFKDTFLRGYSIYVAAALLGADERIAWAVQLAAIILAAVLVWRAGPGLSADRRIALLLVATIVATPHLQFYDMALLAAAAILLFDAAGIGLAELMLFALIWALPLLRPSFLPIGRIAVPIALLSFLAYASWACRTNSPAPKLA